MMNKKGQISWWFLAINKNAKRQKSNFVKKVKGKMTNANE